MHNQDVSSLRILTRDKDYRVFMIIARILLYYLEMGRKKSPKVIKAKKY